MAHQHGTYLGGIRALKDMRDRCRINDETGCWHWGLSVCQGSATVHYVDPHSGRAFRTRGRRAAWALANGPIPAGQYAYATCQTPECVNPAHVAVGTRQQHGEFLRQMGWQRHNPKRIAANRRTVYTKLAKKLNREKARAIRLSDKTQAQLAREYDVPQSTVWAIKAGRAWREPVMRGASVFAMGACE